LAQSARQLGFSFPKLPGAFFACASPERDDSRLVLAGYRFGLDGSRKRLEGYNFSLESAGFGREGFSFALDSSRRKREVYRNGLEAYSFGLEGSNFKLAVSKPGQAQAFMTKTPDFPKADGFWTCRRGGGGRKYPAAMKTESDSGDAKSGLSRAAAWVVGLAILLPVFYVLSTGPVIKLVMTLPVVERYAEPILAIYAPLDYLYRHSDAVHEFLDWYIHLWGVK
jgi:hypothetical protein